MGNEYVVALLKSTWPPFAVQLGTQNVTYIVDHASTASSAAELFEEVERGANIDMKTAIDIALAGAKLISLGLELYLKWKPKTPSPKELAAALSSAVDPGAPIEVRDPVKIEHVAEAIVNSPPLA
jgi:hypothetical protein